MMKASYPVPTEDLLAEWEAEVAHTTIDELGHVAKRAAEWGWRQCAMEQLREASAALTQLEPEAVGPTDEEIMGLMPQQMHDDLAAAVRAMAAQEGIDSTPAKGVLRIMLNRHVVDLARAVLARWGRPAPALAGEVGELVAWLRNMAEAGLGGLDELNADCAAELLERQAAPVPVAVSERLPGDQLCWWFEVDEDCGYGSNWTLLRIKGSATGYTHWLPAHALPLPSEEVES